MNRAVARCFPVLVLACALAAPTVAGAATKYDTSYQNGGMLQLPQLRGVYGQVAQSCEVTGKDLSVAGRFGPNDPGLPSTWRKGQRLGITSVKVRTRQPMMLGIAEVSWKMQRIPTGHVVLGQDFADDGSFAYATRSPRAGARNKLKLFRVGANGKRIKSFGHNGYVSITIAGFDALRPVGFRVIALPERETLVIAQTAETQVILRYTRTGRPDKSWGESGAVELAGPASFSVVPLDAVDSASVTPPGGLLISAYGAPGKPAGTTLGILKLTAAGNVDSSWGANGFWTPPAPKGNASNGQPYTAPGKSLLTSIRKGGDYAVLYADAAKSGVGTLSDLKLAYVDSDSGVTTLFNEKAGSYSNGGDGGFPDANPWILATSSAGPIAAHAESRYDNPGGTFLGEAIRFSADADQPVASAKISNTGFATGAFAVDPAAKYLYFCGSFGVTSTKAKESAKRGQRKSIAIKRVAL